MIIYNINVLFRAPILLAQSLVVVGGLSSILHYRFLKQGSNDIAEPKALIVDRGLFRWIRHPMYISDMIAYTGLFLIAPNLATLMVLLLAYLALAKQAMVEDEFLQATFGRQFSEWRANTRLLMPLIF